MRKPTKKSGTQPAVHSTRGRCRKKQSQILKTQNKASRSPTLLYERASAKDKTNVFALSRPNDKHEKGKTGINDGEAMRSKVVRKTFP